MVIDPGSRNYFQTGDGEDYFNPHIQTIITDPTLLLDSKEERAGGIGIFSNTIGSNNFHFYGDKTFNASTWMPIKLILMMGDFNFLQNTTQLNFSKEIRWNWLKGSTWPWVRNADVERYRLFAGEEASYTNYDPTGDKATDAQGFPRLSTRR